VGIGQNHDKPHAEYVGLCGKEKVKPVTLTDRKALYEYLTGIIDTTPSIDIEGVPAVQPVRAAGSEKLSDDYGKGEQAAGDMEMEEAVEDEEAVAEKRARAAEQARETAARVAEAKTAFAKIIDAPGDAQAEPSADGDEPGSQAAKAANAEKPMHAARAFLKADYSVTKAIVKRELRMRTRQSVLLAPVASTFPVVTQILEGFRKKNAALLEVEARRARHGHPPPAAHAHAPHAHAPYVRAPQPADAASGRPSMAAPRPAHGLKPGLKPGAKPGRGPGIIIVPQSLTSVVNMWNAQQLLKDKRYVPPLEVKQSGETKPAYVKLLHQFEDGTQGQFLITDAPLKLSKAEWDQVVCVFVQGVTWQFKDWPFESEVELFTKNVPVTTVERLRQLGQRLLRQLSRTFFTSCARRVPAFPRRAQKPDRQGMACARVTALQAANKAARNRRDHYALLAGNAQTHRMPQAAPTHQTGAPLSCSARGATFPVLHSGALHSTTLAARNRFRLQCLIFSYALPFGSVVETLLGKL